MGMIRSVSTVAEVYQDGIGRVIITIPTFLAGGGYGPKEEEVQYNCLCNKLKVMEDFLVAYGGEVNNKGGVGVWWGEWNG